MKLMFLPLALLAIVSSIETIIILDFICPKGCECPKDPFATSKLKIINCESPLALTNETFTTAKIKTINVIFFENVTIKNIEKDAFRGFNDLEIVMIKNSTIDYIHPAAFELLELGTISFSGTRFNFNFNLSSSYLEELILSDCKLFKIPSLDVLPSLTVLNLANNFITDIDISTFSNVDSLEELNLSNNSICILNPDIFNNNSALNTLYLDNNPIQIFNLNMVSNLELFSLKSCKLTTFDENSSKNLDLVNYLDLSNNDISLLPSNAFNGMKELNYIDLSNNTLKEISDNIFNDNSKIHKIVFDGNKFNSLPVFSANGQIMQTYFFSCNNCGIKELKNGTFDNMPGLVTIKLSNNFIENLDNIFDNIYGLKELDLSNNYIMNIKSETFLKNVAIETINLSGNPLKSLNPVAFTHNNVLKKLDISNAGLDKIWTNTETTISSLERLLLGNNNLNTITTADLKVMPNLKLIDLNNNPLKCTEDLQEVVLWLIKNSVYPIEGVDKLKTHENLIKDAVSFEQIFDQTTSWKNLAYKACDNDTIFDNYSYKDYIEIKEEEVIQYKTDVLAADKSKTDSKFDDDYYNNYYDYNYDEEEENQEIMKLKKANQTDFEANILFSESILENKNINLTRAFYILSITSVFVLTALVVLTIAVTVTLLILRKNKAFNMQKGNLPRLKIPLWHSTPGQKKHSGSVYRPLSEDLSGPKTPKMSRYEFKSNPTIHNTIP